MPGELISRVDSVILPVPDLERAVARYCIHPGLGLRRQRVFSFFSGDIDGVHRRPGDACAGVSEMKEDPGIMCLSFEDPDGSSRGSCWFPG